MRLQENKLVTAQDAQNALKELFAETLQEMLETEMDTHLGYEKHDLQNKQTSNSRNGKSRKTVISEYGEQEIRVPRDRQSEFEPVVVKKHQSNVTGIEDQIIALYAKASVRERFKIICSSCTGLTSLPGSFPMSRTRSCRWCDQTSAT